MRKYPCCEYGPFDGSPSLAVQPLADNESIEQGIWWRRSTRRRGPALIRAVCRPVVRPWGPFRKSRFVITVACRQLSLGRRPLGDQSDPLMPAGCPSPPRTSFASRGVWRATRGIGACRPDHQTTREPGKGRDGLLSSWTATNSSPAMPVRFGHPRPRHPRRRPSHERAREKIATMRT